MSLDNSSQCSCLSPYEFSSTNGTCICKYFSSPSEYYYDLFTGECLACPVGCTCSSYGCTSCETNTMRTTYSYYLQDGYGSISLCPCLQTASLVNNLCTSCPWNKYYYNGECVPCIHCLTCNWNGSCSSCRNDMTLQNGTCICTNSDLINLNGVCRCPLGQVWIDRPTINTTGFCQVCPITCKDCSTPNFSSIARCVLCAKDVHRQDDPSNNCPCEVGYV